MNRSLLSASLVALLSAGCVTSGGAIALDPIGAIRESKAREEREKREAARQQEEQRLAEERRVADAKAAEERKVAQAKYEAEQARLKELAATTVDLFIPELGLTVKVPGDVEIEKKKASNYGEPTVALEGKASGFWLMLADAKEDRYGLDERVRAHMGEHKFGIDVITRESKGNAWQFEFSTPVYLTDGTRHGTSYGFFARRQLGTAKVNCFAGGLSNQSRLTGALRACDTLKVASK